MRAIKVGDRKRKQSVRKNECISMLNSETLLGLWQRLGVCWLAGESRKGFATFWCHGPLF